MHMQSVWCLSKTEKLDYRSLVTFLLHYQNTLTYSCINRHQSARACCQYFVVGVDRDVPILRHDYSKWVFSVRIMLMLLKPWSRLQKPPSFTSYEKLFVEKSPKKSNRSKGFFTKKLFLDKRVPWKAGKCVSDIKSELRPNWLIKNYTNDAAVMNDIRYISESVRNRSDRNVCSSRV